MDDLSDTIRKIEELTTEPGFIYTLAFILLRDLFLDPTTLAEIDWQDHLNVQELTFLIGLLVKRPINLEIPSEEDSARRFEEVYRLFLELHKDHSHRFFEKLGDHIKHPTPNESIEDNYRRMFGDGKLMTEPIFYSGSGAHDFQYLEFAAEKYREDEPWILDHVGIPVAVMADIARKVKKLHEHKLATHPGIDRGDFSQMCTVLLSVLCFEAQDLADATYADAFIQAFSLTPGAANVRLQVPGQYNELQARPIVELPDGRYFLPIAFNLSESIYESPFYWMNRDALYIETAKRHRGEFAERKTAALLRSVFGNHRVFAKVKIKKGKKETVTDIDVLALAGNRAVIAQVKSKRLTELAKMGDDGKLASDFDGAIQGAYDQGLASRRALVDKENKLFIDEHEIRLVEEVADAYILCVSLDYYPAVLHHVDAYLNRQPGDPLPVALSIFDLDVLAHYLKDPFEFLYYLHQRVRFAGYFRADSEMTLLGFHLKHKLYPQGGTDAELLDSSFGQLIDANFSVVRGTVPTSEAANKLFADWKNEDFQRLIEQTESAGKAGFTDALFFLYDLAGSGADELIKRIKHAKLQTLTDGQSHNAALLYTHEKRGITILSEPAFPDVMQRRLMSLAMIRKYKSRADSWLALGSIAESPNLVDAMAFSRDPWKEDPAMEKLVSERFSGGGRILSPSGRKIGRNEQCPCGSGKKFKRCHGD